MLPKRNILRHPLLTEVIGTQIVRGGRRQVAEAILSRTIWDRFAQVPTERLRVVEIGERATEASRDARSLFRFRSLKLA